MAGRRPNEEEDENALLAERDKELAEERQRREEAEAEVQRLLASMADMEEECEEERRRAAFVREKGSCVDHGFLKRIGAKEERIRLDSHCFKYDGLVRHFKNRFKLSGKESFPDFYFELMHNFFDRPGRHTGVGVMDRTAKPDILKLLLEGEREFLWKRRPQKFTHFHELVDWLQATQNELRVCFAGGDSALEILIIFIIKKCKGGWIMWAWVIVWRLICVRYVWVCAGLINGGANCPKLVPNFGDALALVERHNYDVVKVLAELSESPTMPHDGVNFIVDETLATLDGPVRSDASDEFIKPLLPIKRDLEIAALGKQYLAMIFLGGVVANFGIHLTRCDNECVQCLGRCFLVAGNFIHFCAFAVAPASLVYPTNAAALATCLFPGEEKLQPLRDISVIIGTIIGIWLTSLAPLYAHKPHQYHVGLQAKQALELLMQGDIQYGPLIWAQFICISSGLLQLYFTHDGMRHTGRATEVGADLFFYPYWAYYLYLCVYLAIGVAIERAKDITEERRSQYGKLRAPLAPARYPKDGDRRAAQAQERVEKLRAPQLCHDLSKRDAR
ncbi:unnamed protein product [Vitrella brassicaformis CCMP3155]|uniref:Uncharacterized protein n=1 Tax=Vitrella brassicaformis (strain CCMP3155) TaxID=1169540 RepID=A0A0G4ERU8_VITBC|nr:unnamed protein product [Vitrella brassicaformis CCMP3155]|eukprot:CEM00941.1 unnamed protein product [Vitrella brassicaformis CCMP3155]